MSAQSNLFSRYVTHLPPGELRWIGVRPGRRVAMTSLTHTEAVAEAVVLRVTIAWTKPPAVVAR